MESSSNSREQHDRRKLPKHIFKDGAKWLMSPSKTMLESLTVWPETQNNFTRITHVYWIFSYSVFVAGNGFYISGKDVGLGGIAFSLSLTTVSIETVARRVLSYCYRKRLTNVLSKLYFEFWPSNIAGKKLHEELTKGSYYLFFYCATYTFFAFLYIMQCILIPFLTRNLPYRTAYPFPWQQSPYYELLYVWQSSTLMDSAFNVCGFDLFFVSLLFNCIAQFKLLRGFLKVNFKRAIQMEGNKSTEARKVVLLCIERHKKLIRVCNEINELFTYFILIQYLTSMGTVCLSSFIATAVPEDVGQAFAFLMGHISELLIYCYMGNDLIIESTELSNTVFQCGWHLLENNKDIQKSLMLIMIRSQRPVRISAGGFGFLSLSSFLRLIQFSFSVYTVLNSMWMKQNGVA